MKCEHVRVAPEHVDQTLGVVCLDCNTILCACWMDEHIPESIWNRACQFDSDTNPCEQNRDDYCAICEEHIDSDPPSYLPVREPLPPRIPDLCPDDTYSQPVDRHHASCDCGSCPIGEPLK